VLSSTQCRNLTTCSQLCMDWQSLPFPLLFFSHVVSGLCVLERRTTIAAASLPCAKTCGLCASLHAPTPCILHASAKLHHT
jgi:hypothetical protein